MRIAIVVFIIVFSGFFFIKFSIYDLNKELDKNVITKIVKWDKKKSHYDIEIIAFSSQKFFLISDLSCKELSATKEIIGTLEQQVPIEYIEIGKKISYLAQIPSENIKYVKYLDCEIK